MQVDNLNQNAMEALLADADRALALTRVQDLREAARLVMVADTRKNYIELQRRSRPLIMADTDVISLQRSLDCLRACLRFFNVAV